MSARAQTAEKRPGPDPDPKPSLRLWLKLLTSTRTIENRVRSRLRQDFATTLPRFDVLATLDHADGPLTMGELSGRLLVSNGNVTGVVARLEAEGLLTRHADPADRRSYHVELTGKGRRVFARMAAAHAGWIEALFSDLGAAEIAALSKGLDRIKSALDGGPAGAAR